MQSPRTVLVLLVALAAGCAARPPKEVRAAQAARYQTDPQAVFRAAHEEVDREYNGVAHANPATGLIVGPWRWMDRGGQMKSFQGEQNAPSARTRAGDAVFRLAVEVRTTPQGIQVVVDGYAQLFEPGTPVAVRLEHGDPREPWWVEGRIGAMQLAIHRRLAAMPGVVVVAAAAR